MLRTKNLVNVAQNTTQYNTSVHQIGNTQRARYKVLNGKFNEASSNIDDIVNANKFIYSNLYDLQKNVNILEALVYRYKGRATATCYGSCDTCQTGFSVI